jgi:hypothetical protein
MFEQENEKFFNTLVKEGDIALFANPNLENIISF